ncbi:exosortase E/protease, VPEID-CTERM system [Tabrizicola sp. BL-A-41-H6]|uniref:exosortase E/protease, VPEID-CTERM system n=1 Tax=Tabrizicola sp. BL-A-41-H6 TaxID=3421107 RepID=UPI003D6663C2
MSADPAGHRVHRLGRAATLSALFAAELIGVALLYQFLADIECARTDAQGTCDFLRSLVTRALVVLAVLVLLVRSRPGSFSGFLASSDIHANRSAYITHVCGLVLMLVPLVMGWGGELSQVFQAALVPWAAGAGLAVVGGLLWLAPWLAWKELLWTHSRSSLPILAVAALVPDIAYRVLPIWNWQAMTTVTFSAVAGLLQMVSDTVQIFPEDYVIGLQEFFVSVAPQCSGVEGFALVTVFIAFYAVIFRADIRLGRFLLVILPLGLLLSWLLNVLRISVLILIGAYVSPEVAVNGFHSYAGWLLFTLLAFGLVTFVQSVAWLHREGTRPVGSPVRSDPAAAMILPFFVFMVAGTLVSALFVVPGLGAPLVAVALGLTLVVFLPVFCTMNWRTDLVSLGAGLLVGVLWVLWAPGSDPALAQALALLSPVALAVWAVARVAGTVIFVPIVEEMFFRGYVLTRLDGPQLWRRAAAIAISSLAFATLHGRWLEAGLAGLVFALVMLRRGRVADAVWAHIVANAVVAGVAVVQQDWSLI